MALGLAPQPAMAFGLATMAFGLAAIAFHSPRPRTATRHGLRPSSASRHASIRLGTCTHGWLGEWQVCGIAVLGCDDTNNYRLRRHHRRRHGREDRLYPLSDHVGVPLLDGRSTHMSTHMSIRMSICMSIRMFIRMSMRMSICMFIWDWPTGRG